MRRLRQLIRTIATCATVIASGCAGAAIRSPASTAEESYTVIALPDTQYYSESHPEIFKAQTEWIANQRKDLNIRFVLGLGDIVNQGGRSRQWQNALEAIDTLKDARIPFFLAIGNHDYFPGIFNENSSDRRALQFNRYLGPDYYLEELGYHKGPDPDSNENFYGTVRAGGRNVLILALEFIPRDRVLDWASRVIRQVGADDVIVVTHSYLQPNSFRGAQCVNGDGTWPYDLARSNYGEEMWNKFVSQHPNIRLVLSGHVRIRGLGRRFDLGAEGNLVHQLLSDYQNEQNGGNGWLRIMTVNPVSNRIDVSTYSPYLAAHPELGIDPWKKDPANRFSLDLLNPRSGTFSSATLKGVVKAARGPEPCKGIADAVVEFPGGRTMTDAKGRFSLRLTDSAFRKNQTYHKVKLTITKPGWTTETYTATVRDGAESLVEILLDP